MTSNREMAIMYTGAKKSATNKELVWLIIEMRSCAKCPATRYCDEFDNKWFCDDVLEKWLNE